MQMNEFCVQTRTPVWEEKKKKKVLDEEQNTHIVKNWKNKSVKLLNVKVNETIIE